MDVKYQPPAQDYLECHYLRRNFLTCLKEKGAKDQVPQMNCNVELLLWFNVGCPDFMKEFKNNDTLRQAFLKEKEIESRPRAPKWMKLE